jgi:hypothetical protein
MRPSSPETNFVACGALAALLASLWYVPRSTFLERVLRAGWGVNDPRGRTVDLGSLDTYAEYLEHIVDGISPFYVLLMVFAGGLLLLHRLWQWRRLHPARWLESDWLAVAATVVVAYAILSTSIYKEPRAIMPVLPFFGILLAAMLVKLPWRWLRMTLIVLAIVFGLVQFFAVSYRETQWLVEETRFEVPLVGRVALFARSRTLETPDSGLNDPGYWIIDDVLERVEGVRQREGWDSISLGIVANSSHVHLGMFAYDQILHYPSVQLEDPVQVYPDTSAYWKVYGYESVLVLDEGNRGQALREAVDQILAERRALFDEAFELVKTYGLPDGSRAYLFERRYPASPVTSSEILYDVAEFLHQSAGEGELIVVQPPGLLNGLLTAYRGRAGMVVAVDLDAVPSRLEQQDRIFLVTSQGDELAAPVAELLGPEWLQVQDLWFDGLRVVVFEPAAEDSGQ